MKNHYMTQKKENRSKILINFMKKKCLKGKINMTQKKKNLSKILINFIKIHKLTLALKTSLYRNWSYRGSFQTSPKRGLRSGPKIEKTTVFAMSENFFFLGKNIRSFFRGEMYQKRRWCCNLHKYFEITVKSWKNKIFHRFFDFWPWSRNNYEMIPTT